MASIAPVVVPVQAQVTVTGAVKNGPRTTEFWLTLASVLVSAVTGLGALVHPGFTVPASVSQVVPAAAAAAATVTTAIYTIQRSGLKKATLQLIHAVTADTAAPIPPESPTPAPAAPAAPAVS